MSAHKLNAARFAPSELTPIDRDTARLVERQSAQLGAHIADMVLTIDTLWSENERLQAGIDHNLELVAELRGRLGNRAALLDPAITERLYQSVTYARTHRFLADSMDIEDLEALLVFVTAMGSGQ